MNNLPPKKLDEATIRKFLDKLDKEWPEFDKLDERVQTVALNRFQYIMESEGLETLPSIQIQGIRELVERLLVPLAAITPRDTGPSSGNSPKSTKPPPDGAA